jgi:hypothetical protein
MSCRGGRGSSASGAVVSYTRCDENPRVCWLVKPESNGSFWLVQPDDLRPPSLASPAPFLAINARQPSYAFAYGLSGCVGMSIARRTSSAVYTFP